MSPTTDNPRPIDQGLVVLIGLLKLRGIAVDDEQVRHHFGGVPIGVSEMLRYAKQTGLKARVYKTNFFTHQEDAAARCRVLGDGGFLLLAKVGDDKVLVQSPAASLPQVMKQSELEAIWDGRLVLIARRANLVDLARRFDITWFLGAIIKYRSLLGEVLAASFFLQLFALASPLIFQVVIDKVLVHRSMGTLNVLIAAFFAIAVFETVLGALRTYVFSHTTNRIDVELGARLFRPIVNAGGFLVPGPVGTPGSINVASSLAFQSGAFYIVQVNPSTASTTNVTGTASLARPRNVSTALESQSE